MSGVGSRIRRRVRFEDGDVLKEISLAVRMGRLNTRASRTLRSRYAIIEFEQNRRDFICTASSLEDRPDHRTLDPQHLFGSAMWVSDSTQVVF